MEWSGGRARACHQEYQAPLCPSQFPLCPSGRKIDVTWYRPAVSRMVAESSRRRQTLAQMALAWVLRDGAIASVLIGASSVQQVEQNAGALGHLEFSADELAEIDATLG